ncbi:hypothetical protein GQ457_14G000710 [Hibiscus cannabinus]
MNRLLEQELLVDAKHCRFEGMLAPSKVNQKYAASTHYDVLAPSSKGRERVEREIDVEDKALLWHLRFGHLYYGGLKELAKKNMVHGLPDMDYEGKFCEACVLEKQARTSFQKKAEYRAKHPLKLIHTDICGPITPESFSGKRYFISFVDDFSRKTWVYFLKEKSEAFEAFKMFKV